MKEMDRLIAEAARASEAESFGPYFAERTVRRAREPRRQPARERGIGFWKPALALATLVLLVLVGDRARMHEVSAPAGHIRLVSLPDGSEVSVAPGSKVEFRRLGFGARRRVHLTGEAFFSVATQTSEFRVETFNAAVVVTGTRFNVRTLAEGHRPETVVSLEEGGVRIESVGSPSLDLVPGQSARVDAGGIRLESRLDPQAAGAWRMGGLALVDVPLGDAAAVLEERFGVDLELAPGLAGRPTTYVDPTARELEDILDAVCFALDLRYRPILNGFRIEQAP